MPECVLNKLGLAGVQVRPASLTRFALTPYCQLKYNLHASLTSNDPTCGQVESVTPLFFYQSSLLDTSLMPIEKTKVDKNILQSCANCLGP